jgi:hypothetical protein
MSQFSFYSIDMYVLKWYWSVLVAKPKRKRPLGRPRGWWENDIKVDVREIGWGDMHLIDLPQDRDQWRALVSTAINLRIP